MPLVASVIYALVSASWIFGGFAISKWLYAQDETSIFELFKGLTFVGVSSAVLFVLLHYTVREKKADGATFGEIAGEFREAIRLGEATLARLPILVAVTVIVLVSGLLLGLGLLRERIFIDGESSANALRYSIAAQVGSSLQVIDLELVHLAGDSSQGDVPASSDEIHRLHLRKASLVGDIWIVDASGRVVDSTDKGARAADHSASDFFVHHNASEAADSGLYLGPPHKGVASGRWSVNASRPIRAADSSFQGVVVASLDVAQFGRFWDVPIGTQTLYVELLRDDGTTLMRNQAGKTAAFSNFSRDAKSKMAEVLTSPAGEFRSDHAVDGVTRVFGFGAIPGFSELRLVVGVPVTDSLNNWRKFASVSLAGMLLALGLLATLVWVVMGQMRRRIDSQKLASGLARYPLNNVNPVLTVTRSGARLFSNEAARQLFEFVKGTEDAEQFDAQVLEMASENVGGKRELVVGGRIFAATYMRHDADLCDIYLTDVSKLRHKENLLRMFFELPFTGMAISNPETKRWVEVNDRLCAILGYQRDQLLQMTWIESTHPDDLAVDAANFNQVLNGEIDGYTIEKRFIRADGVVIDSVMDVQAVRALDGTIEQLLATIQDISERKRQQQALQWQRNIYAALSDTNRAIVHRSNREEIFHEICVAAVDRAGVQFAWIGLAEPGTTTLHTAARYGNDDGYVDDIEVSLDPNEPEGSGPLVMELRQGVYQFVRNAEADPSMQSWKACVKRSLAGASAAFPIRQNGVAIGVFGVHSTATGQFDDESAARLLDEMANDTSFAIDHLELERHRAEAVATLEDSEARFRRAIDESPFPVMVYAEDGAVVSVNRSWTEISGYGRDDIPTLNDWVGRAYGDDWVVEPPQIDKWDGLGTRKDEGEYQIRCKDGSQRVWAFFSVSLGQLSDRRRVAMMMASDVTEREDLFQRMAEAEAKYRGLVEQSMVGILILDARTLLYANPRTAEIFDYQADATPGLELERLVHPEDWPVLESKIRKCLAAEHGSETCLFRGRRKEGTIIQIEMQGSVARYMGKYVMVGVLQDITERLLADQQIADSVASLQRAMFGAVNAVSRMTEMRDPYTAGHERRVGEVAAAIAEEMGLDADVQRGLRVAGAVHDVGKITVPSDILTKPRRLSPFEFEIVKTHAEQGYEVLKDIDFPWPVAEIARQHHERMDGSGYPRGLKGEEILLEARILGVADTVEAMSSHRPYRAGLGIDKTLIEIERGRGTIYDQQVADACLRLFREKGYEIPD